MDQANYELIPMALQESEDSDQLNEPLSSVRRKRLRKIRYRSSNAEHSLRNHPNTHKKSNKRNLQILCVLVLVILTLLWLILLTVILLTQQGTIKSLEKQLDSVQTSSQNVPGEIQTWHSFAKRLENNESVILVQLRDMYKNLSIVMQNLSAITSRVVDLEVKLKSTPELVNVPHDLQALSSNMAEFRGHLQELKDANVRLNDAQLNISKSFASIPEELNHIREEFSTLKKELDDKLFSKEPVQAVTVPANATKSVTTSSSTTPLPTTKTTPATPVTKATSTTSPTTDKPTTRVTTVPTPKPTSPPQPLTEKPHEPPSSSPQPPVTQEENLVLP